MTDLSAATTGAALNTVLRKAKAGLAKRAGFELALELDFEPVVGKGGKDVRCLVIRKAKTLAPIVTFEVLKGVLDGADGELPSLELFLCHGV